MASATWGCFQGWDGVTGEAVTGIKGNQYASGASAWHAGLWAWGTWRDWAGRDYHTGWVILGLCQAWTLPHSLSVVQMWLKQDCPPSRGVGAGYAPAVSTQVSCFYAGGLRPDVPGETLVRWPWETALSPWQLWPSQDITERPECVLDSSQWSEKLIKIQTPGPAYGICRGGVRIQIVNKGPWWFRGGTLHVWESLLFQKGPLSIDFLYLILLTFIKYRIQHQLWISLEWRNIWNLGSRGFSVGRAGGCEGTNHLERKHVCLSYHIPLSHTCCPGELGEEVWSY